MTIGTTINSITAQGNGVTTTFTYPFLIPAASYALVTFTATNGTQTVLTPTQYTISGIGTSSGGTITYPLSGSPIASGAYLTIERVLPLVQTTSISNQGPTFAATEAELDYEMMCIQQLNNQVSRAIQINPSDITVSTVLPVASVRAGNYLFFDSNGNPTVAQQLSGSVSVSSVMIPVVEASTLDNAIGEMGIVPTPVEFYGAKGDGITDDSAAINLAMSSSAHVLFTPGKNYFISASSLVVPITCVRIDGYGATVTGPGAEIIGGSASVTTDGFTFTTFYQGGGEIIPVDSYYRLPSVKCCRNAVSLTNAAWVNVEMEYIQFCETGIFMNAPGSGFNSYCVENRFKIGTLEFCTNGISVSTTVNSTLGFQGNEFRVFYMAANGVALNGVFKSAAPGVFINNFFEFAVCDGNGGPGTPIIWQQDFAAGGSNRISIPGGIVGYAANTPLFVGIGPANLNVIDALDFQGTDPHPFGWENYAPAGPRTRLNSGSNIFVQVSTSGSDTTGNGSPGAPYQTMNGALSHIQNLDMDDSTIVIQLASGTYAGALNYNALGGANCRGNLLVAGNTATPSLVVITGGVIANGPGSLITVEGVTVTTVGLEAVNGGDLVLGPSVIFGTMNSSNYHMLAQSGGRITIANNYTITGGAGANVYANDGGLIQVAQATTVSISGTPTFSTAFAAAARCGVCDLNGIHFSGSSTGSRYDVVLNGVVDTNTGNTSYIPGSAGTQGTGGQIN